MATNSAGASGAARADTDRPSNRAGRTDGAKPSTVALSLAGMPRSASVFACNSCGHESPKWHGRCPGCGEWNTLVEERAVSSAGGRGGLGGKASAKAARPVPLREVAAEQVARIGTGIAELDRVLGGGIVPGSLVLIGGSPGIGKSTLTLAALANIRDRVLYVTGEESPAQVRLRAERISHDAL